MNKSFGLKVLGGGKSPTEEHMQKINRFALVELKPEQVYVRRYLMAHNGIDRDNERFSDSVLDEFASSLPGKGFFVEGHPGGWSGKGAPGEGLFFDAATQKMTPERFEEITGESVRLPEGVAKVKVLWGDAYLLRLDSNQDTLAKIDAGIYKFTSIGFRAALRDVAGEDGNRL